MGFGVAASPSGPGTFPFVLLVVPFTKASKAYSRRRVSGPIPELAPPRGVSGGDAPAAKRLSRTSRAD